MRGEVISGLRGMAQCKDGGTITVSLSAAGLHDSHGRAAGVVLNFLDTTEQTFVEESLRRNEELFRATFDQAAVGMNFVSLDGRFLRVNPTILRNGRLLAGRIARPALSGHHASRRSAE